MLKRKAAKTTARASRRRAAGLSKYVVFISHSSLDAWIASQIAKEIEGIGAQVWLDQKDLQGGDIIRETIREAIKACNEAIVLVSAESIKSPWVSYEMGVTSGLDKRVTPVSYNVPPDALKVFADVKSVDLNHFDQLLSELKQRIKQRVKN